MRRTVQLAAMLGGAVMTPLLVSVPAWAAPPSGAPSFGQHVRVCAAGRLQRGSQSRDAPGCGRLGWPVSRRDAVPGSGHDAARRTDIERPERLGEQRRSAGPQHAAWSGSDVFRRGEKGRRSLAVDVRLG